MAALDDIAQERQRLVERLARLDGERGQLAEQLAELEAAERVLTRLAQARSRTGRRAAAPRATPAAKAASLSLGDASLRAVAAHADGISVADVRAYLAREFDMQVRPNHLGMALQRHRRAGRLEQRSLLWHLRQSAEDEAAPSGARVSRPGAPRETAT